MKLDSQPPPKKKKLMSHLNRYVTPLQEGQENQSNPNNRLIYLLFLKSGNLA